MKIASANLQMESSHLATQEHQVRESLKMWLGARRPDLEAETRNTPQPASPRVEISLAAQQAQQLESSETSAIKAAEDELEKDPKLLMIRSVIEMLTGRKVRLFNAEELRQNGNGSEAVPGQSQSGSDTANRPAGYGVEYDYHEYYKETETTSFSARGQIKTEDGREIGFSIDLVMSRSYQEESSVSIRMGDAVMKDPLVLNFNGSAAQLTDTRFQFDLDADGAMDSIHFVKPGSGFLVLDRNGDSRINDGREMFGALTGDGFKELAALDADGNGWIDENDPAFQDLKIWTKDGQGADQLRTLQEANVGAISLARVATPFSIKDASNQLQGQIQSTGVFLQETGGAGTIQKLDLVA